MRDTLEGETEMTHKQGRTLVSSREEAIANLEARAMTIEPTTEGFWSKVDTTGGIDACWPWTGKRSSDGYGEIWENGRHRQATHVALRLAGRPLQSGQYALHHCDNPPCVNFAHLFAGSPSDNVRDAVAKGRWSNTRGALNGQAKLTREIVDAIRADTESTHVQLARKYGISDVHVSRIVRFKTWK